MGLEIVKDVPERVIEVEPVPVPVEVPAKQPA